MRKVKLREVYYNTDEVRIECPDPCGRVLMSRCFIVPGSSLVDATEIVIHAPRCECGSTVVGSPAHSRWCPKHE